MYAIKIYIYTAFTTKQGPYIYCFWALTQRLSMVQTTHKLLCGIANYCVCTIEYLRFQQELLKLSNSIVDAVYKNTRLLLKSKVRKAKHKWFLLWRLGLHRLQLKKAHSNKENSNKFTKCFHQSDKRCAACLCEKTWGNGQQESASRCN